MEKFYGVRRSVDSSAPPTAKSGPPSPLSRGGMKTYDNKNSGRRSGV